MKAIILAGGMGSRLKPLTDIVNKFLLPVYDKPLIEYSIENLKRAGIDDIAIVLGKKSAGLAMEYLQSGKKFGVNFTYFFQDEPLGIPHAISYTEKFANGENIVVMFADNIILDEVSKFTNQFQAGCLVSCKVVNDADEIKKFGVVCTDKNGKVTHLEEKPKKPKSNLALAGIQIYDNKIYDFIKELEISDRGEYEVTHIINEYIKRNQFYYDTLEDEWIDAGNPNSLFQAGQLMYNRAQNKH
ncbi:MAG: hypothetical protein K0R18_1285 [Bacillales bacterium]|jgi:glucose-1-phosphate thymidylyltransferase|nr:hypothetical protein [Bacillales bacterium]